MVGGTDVGVGVEKIQVATIDRLRATDVAVDRAGTADQILRRTVLIKCQGAGDGLAVGRDGDLVALVGGGVDRLPGHAETLRLDGRDALLVQRVSDRRWLQNLLEQGQARLITDPGLIGPVEDESLYANVVQAFGKSSAVSEEITYWGTGNVQVGGVYQIGQVLTGEHQWLAEADYVDDRRGGDLAPDTQVRSVDLEAQHYLDF